MIIGIQELFRSDYLQNSSNDEMNIPGQSILINCNIVVQPFEDVTMIIRENSSTADVIPLITYVERLLISAIKIRSKPKREINNSCFQKEQPCIQLRFWTLSKTKIFTYQFQILPRGLKPTSSKNMSEMVQETQRTANSFKIRSQVLVSLIL